MTESAALAEAGTTHALKARGKINSHGWLIFDTVAEARAAAAVHGHMTGDYCDTQCFGNPQCPRWRVIRYDPTGREVEMT
jgi:hypothetical protein